MININNTSFNIIIYFELIVNIHLHKCTSKILILKNRLWYFKIIIYFKLKENLCCTTRNIII